MSDDLSGFASIPRWIQRDPKVSPYAKLIYITISSRIGINGAAFPSHETMATDAGVSITTVKRALEELRAMGVLTWKPLRPGGSNIYALSTSRTVGPTDPPPKQGVGLTDLGVGLTDLGGRSVRPTKDSTKYSSNETTEPSGSVVAPKSKRGTRCPEDFEVTPEMHIWAVDKHITVDLALATEVFVNYWTAKAGQNATKLNWERTWQNWILSDQANGKFQQPNAAAFKRHPNTEQAKRLTAILREKEAAQDAHEAERHLGTSRMALGS